jgi:hypothetical protein
VRESRWPDVVLIGRLSWDAVIILARPANPNSAAGVDIWELLPAVHGIDAFQPESHHSGPICTHIRDRRQSLSLGRNEADDIALLHGDLKLDGFRTSP